MTPLKKVSFRIPDYENLSNEELGIHADKLNAEFDKFNSHPEKPMMDLVFQLMSITMRANYCFRELFKREGIDDQELKARIQRKAMKNLGSNFSKN